MATAAGDDCPLLMPLPLLPPVAFNSSNDDDDDELPPFI